MKKKKSSYRKLKKIFFHHLHPKNLISQSIAVVLVWRGVWGLLDLYFIPENPFLSYSVSCLIGVILLYIGRDKYRSLL